MRALCAYGKNDASKLIYEDAPLPKIESGDVLVRVHACGVSPAELTWPSTWIEPDGTDRALPIIPGHEVSGVIEARADDASGLDIGDAVYGLIDFQRDGADAEFVAARAGELTLKPSTLDHIRAAAVPLSGLTAWQAIFDHAHLRRGQRVLIHGGGGGVGSFAVQLARWCGAYVIATASAKDSELVRELGADLVLDYRLDRFDELVHDVDVVFDTVGGDIWRRSWSVIRPGGTLVSVAVPRPPIESAPGSVQAIWFVVSSCPEQLAEIAKLIDAGHLRPVVADVLPLASGAEAFASTHRARPGKIVLNIAEVRA